MDTNKLTVDDLKTAYKVVTKIMKCRQDVIEIGAEILERELTEEEINELTEAMEGRYNLYCEMYDEDVDIDA